MAQDTLYGLLRQEDSRFLKIQVPEGGLLLRGAGATFPAPLYDRWFAEYQRFHPKAVLCGPGG
ncbi:MAG: hypothetical protein NTY19_45265 [Planctomycetota bacterium]|nr:hypothetical protein [Planctomycetota bacterium]